MGSSDVPFLFKVVCCSSFKCFCLVFEIGMGICGVFCLLSFVSWCAVVELHPTCFQQHVVCSNHCDLFFNQNAFVHVILLILIAISTRNDVVFDVSDAFRMALIHFSNAVFRHTMGVDWMFRWMFVLLVESHLTVGRRNTWTLHDCANLFSGNEFAQNGIEPFDRDVKSESIGFVLGVAKRQDSTSIYHRDWFFNYE